MVTAGQRREAVTMAMTAAAVPERQACRYTGFSRSSQRYRLRRSERTALRERLATLATLQPRWGYRRLCWLLRREELGVNRKLVYRVYRELDLSLRRRTRKRVAVVRQPLAVLVRPNARWSMDFVSDALDDGRKFRGFTVVDDFTREGVALEVALGFTGHGVARVLDRAIGERAMPATIVCDNGPEFTSQALDQWAHERGIQLHFIEPGKPMQNAFAAIFNGRVRGECLNETWFLTLAEAEVTLGAWRADYNAGRPQGSSRSLTPTEFAARWSTSTRVDQPQCLVQRLVSRQSYCRVLVLPRRIAA